MTDMTPQDDNLKPGDVPLCKDCRWERTDAYGLSNCHHKSLFEYSPVDGGMVFPRLCREMRGDYDSDGYCGPSGKLFEPRRSWWRRLCDRWWQRTELDRLKGEIARLK